MKTNEIAERLRNIESMLEMQKPKPMTFDAAAEYLGISKSHLYKLTSQGKIPHYKPYGRKIYFDKVSLDQWVYSKPVKGSADIEAEAIKYLSK